MCKIYNITVIFEVIWDVVADIKDVCDSKILQDSFVLGMDMITQVKAFLQYFTRISRRYETSNIEMKDLTSSDIDKLF